MLPPPSEPRDSAQPCPDGLADGTTAEPIRVAPPRRRPFPAALVVSLVAGLLVVVALGAALRQRARLQPVVALLETQANSDPARRQAARATLLENPDLNAPLLVSVIRRGKNRWHGQILPWLDDIPALARRRTHQILMERHAIDVLQRMGPKAAPHVLDLLVETRYGGRDIATALLRAYGPAVCPFLVQSLNDPRPPVRAGVAATLGRFPSAHLGSLDPLRRAASDPHPAVRASGVWALGQMHDRATEIIPDLVRALPDSDPRVPIEAAVALRFYGAQASIAVPELRRCLGSPVDAVRANAALTLVAIGGDDARTAEPELLLALRRSDGASARQAAVALVQLDLHTREALDRLTAFLRHRDATIRTRTLEAIRGLGSRGEPLIPALLALLENTDERDNRPALVALRNIQPSAIPERYRQGRRSP